MVHIYALLDTTQELEFSYDSCLTLSLQTSPKQFTELCLKLYAIFCLNYCQNHNSTSILFANDIDGSGDNTAYGKHTDC